MSTATMYARRNQNLYRNRTSVKLGPVSVGFVTIALVCALALLYLTQITKTSIYGYRQSELAKTREQLMVARQDLEVEAARLQSVQEIQASAAVGKMVPTTQVTYANGQ